MTTSLNHTRSIADNAGISAEEWKARVDLAACYRLVARNGWDDLILSTARSTPPAPTRNA